MDKITTEVLRGKTDIKHFMSVDPGLGGTGVAYWPLLIRGQKQEPEMTWALTGHRREDWRQKLSSITDQFQDIVWRIDEVTTLLVELTNTWTKSKKSRAANARGDLAKQCALIGALLYVAQDWNQNIVVATPFARDWKGELTKAAVHGRIRARLGRDYGEHVADAVGIGLAVQGVLSV